jgi:hypothetical protein
MRAVLWGGCLVLALGLGSTGLAEVTLNGPQGLGEPGGEARTVLVRIEDAPEAGQIALSWSAVPLDLPEGADVFSQMQVSGDDIAGPWTVALMPGRRYQISGYSDSQIYETTVQVTPQTVEILVPPLAAEQSIPFRCDAPGPCDFADPVTGLQFALPGNWAAEQPERAEPGAGGKEAVIRAVFFEEMDGDGGGVWFLNPQDWLVAEDGPCASVAVGQICTFERGPAAVAAEAILAPSLAMAPGQR